MLNHDAASTAYSNVALGFDPYYAISVSETCLQHEPGGVGHYRILLTLHEHIVGDETGYSARCRDAIEVAAEVLNQCEKFIVVSEQARIVEGCIVVGWTCNRELNGLIRNLLHCSTVAKHDTVDCAHSSPLNGTPSQFELKASRSS